MVKLVIFDLDGTLVNSVEDLADSVNRALVENGYSTHPIDDYYHFVGDGTKKLIERALPKGTSAFENERIHEIFSKYYEEGCLNKTAPYEGICDTLDKLNDMGIVCAVASNKPDVFSHHIIESLFKKEDFAFVCGKLEGTKAKPAPDIIFKILSLLDIPSENAIIAGDSDVDVLTAHNAGIKCIGCEWGFRGREELENAGADFIAKTPYDIVDICKIKRGDIRKADSQKQ